MTWEILGEYTLSSEWILTPPLVNELFRIKHLPIENFQNEYMQAAFAQAFVDESLHLFEPKRLSYRQESEIFIHRSPVGLTNRQLAFKRLDENLHIDWIIQAEVYVSDESETNLANLIVEKLDQIMAIYSRGSLGLTPNSGENQINADTPSLLVREESKRQQLVIRSTTQAIELYSSLNDNGVPQGLIEKLSANEVFELPTTQGVYRGDVYVVASMNTRVNYTQYIS